MRGVQIRGPADEIPGHVDEPGQFGQVAAAGSGIQLEVGIPLPARVLGTRSRPERGTEGVFTARVIEDGPPQGGPAARPYEPAELGQPGGLVDPVERGGRHGEIEAALREQSPLEDLGDDLHIAADGGQSGGHVLIGLDRGHPGTDRHEPARDEPGPGTDLEHRDARPQAAAGGEDLVHLSGIIGPARIVARRVTAVDRPRFLAEREQRRRPLVLARRHPRLYTSRTGPANALAPERVAWRDA
ncbi:MAG TPA: hypothetical protein VK280_08855 [Streptosporangiaceae bacterium]|nr:hypothetical protein [Streptosporangiaceae bacterium]